MTFLIGLAAFAAFEVAAVKYGADSRDHDRTRRAI